MSRTDAEASVSSLSKTSDPARSAQREVSRESTGLWEGMALVASEDGGDLDHFPDDDTNPLKVLPSQYSPHSPPIQDGWCSGMHSPVVRGKRPTKEVQATVDHWFTLGIAGRRTRTRIHTLVGSLVHDTCPVPELSLFYSYLMALLTTLFAPVASFADCNEKRADDRNPVVSMVNVPVMKDIIASARVSLKEYHDHSVNASQHFLKKVKGLTEHLRRRSSPSASQQSGIEVRRLSCYSLPRTIRDAAASPASGSFCSSVAGGSAQDHGLDVVGSFSAAFVDGSAQSLLHPPKKRPDSRIDRKGSKQSGSCSPTFNHTVGTVDSTGSGLGQATNNSNINNSNNNNNNGIHSNSHHRASMDNLARLSSRRGSLALSGFRAPSAAPSPPLPELSTTHYFDIIVETIAVVMTVKYEHQLMELTVEGEASGVRRAAEWVAARMLDEMHNDGIDATQPLCEQLVLCAEGLAYEEGEYVWRHCNVLDAEVMAMVWGDPPPDVLDGRLEGKTHSGGAWYEWGCFAQPGIRTADGRLFTGPRLNPLQYRYRLGTPRMAESLGLRNSSAVPLRAPSFLSSRPGRLLAEGGITLSAPPEGSEHRGGTMPRPHIRPATPLAMARLENRYLARYRKEEYCDNDLYAWSFDEAMRQQRAAEKGIYSNMSNKGKCCPCCCVS